jgi:hypothetical protein
MADPNEALKGAWKRFCERWIEGYKLCTDGDECCAEGYKLLAEGFKLRAEGFKLRAKAGKRLAERDSIWVEGDKLCAEGYKLLAEGKMRWDESDSIQAAARLAWAKAVIAVCGEDYTMEWLDRPDRPDGMRACELGTGEIFEPI